MVAVGRRRRGARGNPGESPDQAAAAAPLFLRFPLVVVCAPAFPRRRSSLSLFRFGRRIPRESASGRVGRDPSLRETESDGSSTPAGLRNLSRLLGVERLLAGLWGDGAEGGGGGGPLDGGEQSPLPLSSSSVSRFLILIPLPTTTSSRMSSRALLVLRGLARSISFVEDLGPKLDIDVRRFEAL